LSLKAKRKGEATERHVGYMEQPGSRHGTRRLPLPSRDDERTLGTQLVAGGLEGSLIVARRNGPALAHRRAPRSGMLSEP